MKRPQETARLALWLGVLLAGAALVPGPTGSAEERGRRTALFAAG